MYDQGRSGLASAELVGTRRSSGSAGAGQELAAAEQRSLLFAQLYQASEQKRAELAMRTIAAEVWAQMAEDLLAEHQAAPADGRCRERTDALLRGDCDEEVRSMTSRYLDGALGLHRRAIPLVPPVDPVMLIDAARRLRVCFGAAQEAAERDAPPVGWPGSDVEFWRALADLVVALSGVRAADVIEEALVAASAEQPTDQHWSGRAV